MAYINKFIKNVNGEKAYEILLSLGYKMGEAQRLIDRARLACDGEVVREKNAVLFGNVSLIEYECNPRGLMPIFETQEFAVFDKPSGVLSHPNGRHCEYSLNDEIWHLFGKKAAVAHRLDRETSGLIVVAKNPKTQVELKRLFEERAVKKSYLAMVVGQTAKNFTVDKAMDLADNYDDVKTRMKICDDGKSAITKFELVKYFKDIGASLLRCYPLTGRQHQIRLHLFHEKHKILGEPLYGLSRDEVIKILDNEMSEAERFALTGASRLLLHADEISFEFNSKIYNVKSKFNTCEEFYRLAKI